MFLNSVVVGRKLPIHSTAAALLAGAASITGTGNAGTLIGGTGALLAGASAIAGVGTLTIQGMGALAADAAVVAGAGNAGTLVAGSGALAAQAAVVAGSGKSSSTGTGALAAGAAAVAGVGTVASATSYANTGGTGDRRTIIRVYGKQVCAQGTYKGLINGNFGNNGTNAFGFASSGTAEGISFDFTLTGFKQVIDEINFYSQTNATQGTWVVEAWDGSAWATLKTAFTLGGAAGSNLISFTNSTPYDVYRLRQTGGTTNSSPWIQEIEFKIAQGPAISSSTSYANTGGTGNRTAGITISTTAPITGGGAGTVNNLIDGAFAANSTDAVFWDTGQSSREIKFDFGTAKTIDRFKWYQDTFVSGAVETLGHGEWIFAGSNDDSTYTELGGWLTLDASGGAGNGNEYTCPNSTAYRYYKLIQTGGTTSNHPWLEEIEFKIV